jgi:hypothetical protein
MSSGGLVRASLREGLLLHPRVVFQRLVSTPEERALLADTMPPVIPFGGRVYHDVLPVLDWDHRLPSRALLLRLYIYYTPASAARGRAAYEGRVEEIARRDKFPEFDVPDFEGLLADESYEVTVDLAGRPDRLRLVSEWRREVATSDAVLALELVRASQQFLTIREGSRSPYLGDLEAVGWCPPCESDYDKWTIDVWYLTEFDGLIGKGHSFLVDTTTKQVVATREFMVRASEGRL